MTNLIDRKDIIRFCCSRSWQAIHIIKALFALNQIDHDDEYDNVQSEIDALPQKPVLVIDRLHDLTCSKDFRKSAATGISLIKDILIMADSCYPELRSYAFLRSAENSSPETVPLEKRNLLAQSIAETYFGIHGIQGIIVDGSLARGLIDLTSDIDLKAYCSVIPDISSRKARARMIDPKSQVIPESDRLTINGVYVHIDFEIADKVERTFSPSPDWRVLAIWESLQIGRILWDPYLMIKKWKSALPNISKEAKIKLIYDLFTHLQYDKQRLDVSLNNNNPIYSSIILGNILTFYFQILGVINNQYMSFPKWMHHLIHEFDYKPDNVYRRFSDMLSTGLDEYSLSKLKGNLESLINDLNRLCIYI